jgi:hypothetical protein
MKNTIKIFALAVITVATISQLSCSKEKVIIPDAESYSAILTRNFDVKEDLIVEEILDEVIADLEEYDFLKSESTCPVKTIEKPEDTKYPKVITKDYGEGCITDNGKERSGKIIITVSGPWLQKGTKRTVSFENYTHRGIAVSGGKEIICKGLNEDNLYMHTINGDLTLVRPDGIVVEREIHKKRILLTEKRSDGPRQWLVDGYVKVSRSNGIAFKMEITTPLHRIQGCRWFQSGIKVLHFKASENLDFNHDHKVRIDYSYSLPESTDACDSYVRRWVDDEEAEVRNLQK